MSDPDTVVEVVVPGIQHLPAAYCLGPDWTPEASEIQPRASNIQQEHQLEKKRTVAPSGMPRATAGPEITP